jgi:hypothetical protein
MSRTHSPSPRSSVSGSLGKNRPIKNGNIYATSGKLFTGLHIDTSQEVDEGVGLASNPVKYRSTKVTPRTDSIE